MNQQAAIIFTVIGNAIWSALMVWGIIRGLRPRQEKIFTKTFTGTLSEVVDMTNNYAEQNDCLIQCNPSVLMNLKTGKYELIVTYKTKK